MSRQRLNDAMLGSYGGEAVPCSWLKEADIQN